MTNFNTETTKLIKTAKPTTDEEKIISSLFVADADQAVDDFELQKEGEIEDQL